MAGALEGIRVVDFGQYIAGPLAAVMLAEQGADVVHVDPPGGPRWNVPADAFLNRSKRRITLNLKSQQDLATAQQLVERADVVIENFRPGVMDRVGVVPAILGPYNLVDIGTGVLTAFATSLALFHKARTGQGQHVQTSLCQTATYHQTIYALDYAGAVHDEPRGWEALGSGPRQRFYQASDGWFFLFSARDADSPVLDQLVGFSDDVGLETAFAQRPAAHWLDCLRQAGISAHAVVNLPDLMRDPWVREHGLSISQTSDEAGDVTYPGASVKLSATPMRIGSAARRPGGDAHDVFSEIGSAEIIPALERAWALQIADPPPGW